MTRGIILLLDCGKPGGRDWIKRYGAEIGADGICGIYPLGLFSYPAPTIQYKMYVPVVTLITSLHDFDPLRVNEHSMLKRPTIPLHLNLPLAQTSFSSSTSYGVRVGDHLPPVAVMLSPI